MSTDRQPPLPQRLPDPPVSGQPSDQRRIELASLSFGDILPIAFGTIRRLFSVRDWIASLVLAGATLLLLVLGLNVVGSMLGSLGRPEGFGVLGMAVLAGGLVSIAAVPMFLLCAVGFVFHAAWRLAVWETGDGAPWTPDQTRPILAVGLRSIVLWLPLLAFGTGVAFLATALIGREVLEPLVSICMQAAFFTAGSVALAQSLVDERPMTQQMAAWFDKRMFHAAWVSAVSGLITSVVVSFIVLGGAWVMTLGLATVISGPPASWGIGLFRLLLKSPVSMLLVAAWVVCASIVAGVAGIKAFLAALVTIAGEGRPAAVRQAPAPPPAPLPAPLPTSLPVSLPALPPAPRQTADRPAGDEPPRPDPRRIPDRACPRPRSSAAVKEPDGFPIGAAIATGCVVAAAALFFMMRSGSTSQPEPAAAEFHGSWRSSQPGCSYLFELHSDGSFDAWPEDCNISTRTFVGTWRVTNNKMIWIHDSAARPDANPIRARTADRFELQEQDGGITTFTRLKAPLRG